MPIKNLNQIQATSIIAEINTDGHSPLKITANDFNIYVAKNGKGHIPSIYLINELIADYFLRLWDLPVADSNLVNIPIALIQAEKLSNNHRIGFYETPCFASRWVENSIDVNDFLVSHNKKTYNKFLNPNDFLRISLFDEWLENDDRKPTNYNLILEPISKKYKIIHIDHAFIFGTMNYRYLDPNGYVPRANDHLMASEMGALIRGQKLINEQVINNEREYFYLCLERCLENFEAIFNQITTFYPLDEDDIQSIKSFIFNHARNQKVFDEYVYRILNG